MIKGIIFDFFRTLYDPESDALNDGAIETLEELKKQGYQLCLVSQMESRNDLVLRFGLEKYFINIRFAGNEKSAADFESCANIMGLKMNEVAVVGDRIKKEIFFGNKLGMHTIWYNNGNFSDETPENDSEKPAQTISNLSRLKTLIKEL